MHGLKPHNNKGESFPVSEEAKIPALLNGKRSEEKLDDTVTVDKQFPVRFHIVKIKTAS